MNFMLLQGGILWALIVDSFLVLIQLLSERDLF